MDNKYSSIDPLILETLNLNEQRMNHILDILHGRQGPAYARNSRRATLQSPRTNKTILTINQFNPLPPILLNSRNLNQNPTRKSSLKQAFPSNSNQLSLNRSRSNEKVRLNQSFQRSRTIDRGEKSEKTQSRRAASQRRLKEEADQINIEQQMLNLQESKKEQIMRSYMASKIQRSKSQQEIHPRDIYRMEIESIVGELTSIEDLPQAEKRMQRLKKRYKHLATFDKNYYTKLNEHDLINLS